VAKLPRAGTGALLCLLALGGVHPVAERGEVACPDDMDNRLAAALDRDPFSAALYPLAPHRSLYSRNSRARLASLCMAGALLAGERCVQFR